MVQGEAPIDHEMLPVQIHEHIIPESPLMMPEGINDTVTIEASERSATPPPPSSSPPPLSPAKGDKSSSSSCSSDEEEQWREPQLKNSFDDVDDDSCSSFDTDQLSGADDLLDEIDQSANHSNLSAIVAKGMNDSLGTVSNLSEEVTTSLNLLSPPPLPLSPPPDL